MQHPRRNPFIPVGVLYHKCEAGTVVERYDTMFSETLGSFTSVVFREVIIVPQTLRFASGIFLQYA